MFEFLKEVFLTIIIIWAIIFAFIYIFGGVAVGKNSSRMKSYNNNATKFTNERLKNGAGRASKQEIKDHSDRYYK